MNKLSHEALASGNMLSQTLYAQLEKLEKTSKQII